VTRSTTYPTDLNYVSLHVQTLVGSKYESHIKQWVLSR